MMRPGRRAAQLPMSNNEERDKGASRFRMFPLANNCVHAIPFIVFLCFFTLWFLSRPVNVEIKDGKIVAIHQVDRTDVPIATSDDTSSTPIALAPQALTGNETEADHWKESLLILERKNVHFKGLVHDE